MDFAFVYMYLCLCIGFKLVYSYTTHIIKANYWTDFLHLTNTSAFLYLGLCCILILNLGLIDYGVKYTLGFFMIPFSAKTNLFAWCLKTRISW